MEPKPLGSDRLYTYAFAIADINRDGALDIVEACFGCANRLWFNNRSLDPFKDVVPVIFDPSKSSLTTSLVIADINEDHLPDLIVGDRHKTNSLYLNNGTNNPFDSALPITDHNNATTSLKLCDVDQDEDLDLIEGNFNEPNGLYLNHGAPDYFSEYIPVNTNLDDTQSIALSDMNNDGLIDLIVGNFEEQDRLFLNTQDRIPFSEEAATFIGNDFTQTLAVHIHDLNGDGYLDIITAGSGPNLMYLNNGTASPFENVTAVEITSDYKTRGIALADLDGDFDVDMIEVNYEQQNMLYINHAISGFSFISDERNCTYQIDFCRYG
ncbi:MAG: FG-GAP repeat-containing protein [Candidatus Magnetoglobus multicellularis str. Araruama]|uniref:FG-GAP repeat-containing protein n=1 Tax=Candidatus Magnetoglobus multicellularis str. Araruama TaxID=890399 RepID=A0A1V1NXN3_9BACT|nr:MAG: FG-GAP repeat-containing protein [Candidatus Magnetoglobus multicellularis str. Araruama]